MIENNSWNPRREVTDLDGKKKGFVEVRICSLISIKGSESKMKGFIFHPCVSTGER